MKIKVSELQGAALDWAVAKCEEYQPRDGIWFELYPKEAFEPWEDGTARTDAEISQRLAYFCAITLDDLSYSTDWSQGGPIIEREKVRLWNYDDDPWEASIAGIPEGKHKQYGPTPLIAAMRCYVANKLSDVVDIPEELCKD